MKEFEGLYNRIDAISKHISKLKLHFQFTPDDINKLLCAINKEIKAILDKEKINQTLFRYYYLLYYFNDWFYHCLFRFSIIRR